MDVLTAAQMLGDQLDATEQRYPTNTRLLHIASAMALIAREHENKINEYVGYIELPADSDHFNVGSIAIEDSPVVTIEAIRSIFYTSEYESTAFGYTPSGTWTRLMPYSDYSSLINDYPDIESSTPEAYSWHGDTAHVRPAASEDLLLMVTVDTVPGLLLSGTNRMLEEIPFAVIFRAAMIACAWLEDEERIQVYDRMYQEQIEPFCVMDSMRNDGPWISTEA